MILIGNFNRNKEAAKKLAASLFLIINLN